jgi:hypothetical protein
LSKEVLGEVDTNLNAIFGSLGITENVVYPVTQEVEKKTFHNGTVVD